MVVKLLEALVTMMNMMIVFYSQDLETTLDKVEKAGGNIAKSIFSFPGGRRFQFTEPSSNEFGVWSDKDV